MRLRNQANKAGNKRKWIFDSKGKSTQKHIHKQDRIVLCKRKQCLAINFQRQKFNFLQQKTFKYCDSLCLPFTFLKTHTCTQHAYAYIRVVVYCALAATFSRHSLFSLADWRNFIVSAQSHEGHNCLACYFCWHNVIALH